MRAEAESPIRPGFLLAVLGAVVCVGASKPQTSVGTLVLTQAPASASRSAALAGGVLRSGWGAGARIVRISPRGDVTVLTRAFESAADPDVSFDGTRILFAGRKEPGGSWCVWEMNADGTGTRQITCGGGDCRTPVYLPPIYTLTPTTTEATNRVAFVGTEPGETNEYGVGPKTSLYSCKLDGSSLHRLSYNLSSDVDPYVLHDGRMIFSAWLRHSLDRGPQGRVALLGMNIDGTDDQIFAGDEGLRVKQMPTETTEGLVVFVEANAVEGDGSGSLGAVSLRRNLHSYRRVTGEGDGFFHSPSPLPGGRILVSWRPGDGTGTHGVYSLDLATGRRQRVFDDPGWNDMQAKALSPRAAPDARSSVVKEDDAIGSLFALDVGINGLDPRDFPAGTARTLRVLEGQARRSPNAVPPLATRWLLGEVPLAEDGSFQVQVPANVPIQLQILDGDGLALRSSAWIWVRSHVNQGCVGCHEDPERTPPNRFVKAVQTPAPVLNPPAGKRRTVDFRRDVMPVLRLRCFRCHGEGGEAPRLDGAAEPEGGPNRAYRSLLSAYVVPGAARRSRVVWHLFGRNTSRPWDEDGWMKDVARMPSGAEPLSPEDLRTLVEWIDYGALWDAQEEDQR
jgi:Hydrazine synthase alpha subunit middle domain